MLFMRRCVRDEFTRLCKGRTDVCERSPVELPFGFGLSIGEIANSFAIMQNGSIVANLSTVCYAASIYTCDGVLMKPSASWCINIISPGFEP